MAMQGIDISGWQAGIDLSKVPCDFVIVKATQGVNFVSNSCDAQVQQAIALGKPFGFYHYVDGSGAQAEADFFIDNCAGYFGKGIPCIDWENAENSAWGNTGYLKQLVQRVIDRTGVKPLIYASASSFPWDVAQALNCGAWVAQYASNNATGYQDSPWNEGAYDCAIRQYSSAGRLAGYNGNLDLDKAYMDADGWAKYVGAASDDSGKDKNPQNAGNPVNDSGFAYRAHVADYGWLDAVRDGQIAGTTGKGKQLEAIKITPPEGLELSVKFHIQNKGWQTWSGIKKGTSSGEGSSTNDPIIGTVGESLRAEALEVNVISNTTGKNLKYRVHVADYGWTDWVNHEYTAGTVGISKAIEAVQFVLE